MPLRKPMLLFALLVTVIAADRATSGQEPERKAVPPQSVLPAFDAQKVIVQSDVQYGAAGERPLKLDIYLPAEPRAKRLPAVVWIHGGGWSHGNYIDVERIDR